MKITFQPLDSSDYPQFAHWLAEPHVAKWWHDGPPTVDTVIREYTGDKKTSIYLILADTQPIGIIQSYLNEDYPSHFKTIKMPGTVGIDLFIGDPNYIGKGYGAQVIYSFIQGVVREFYPTATGVVADPAIENKPSIRAFEKAGFIKGMIVPGEEGPEQIMILTFSEQ